MSIFDAITATLSGTDEAGLDALSAGQRSALETNAGGTIAQVGGALAGGLSHLQFGMQAQAAAEFQAAQLRQNAGQAQAASQRTAMDVDKQAAYTASAALATAAASGGGASDPTVVNLIAKNAGEFAYRKQVALYGGDDKARLDNLTASAKEFEGGNVMRNSMAVAGSQLFGADTTLIKGMAKGASMYERFGGGGPKLNSANDAWANDGPGE